MSAKIFIFGANGRMGQEIATNIGARQKKGEAIELVSRLEDKPDAVIDFSSPAGAVEASRWCAQNKIPLVCGTTGLNVEELKALEACAKTVATLYSANMSLGVNALAESLAQFSAHFDGGEVAIEEIHHKHKKDYPSGTAKLLHQVVKRVAPQFRISEPISIRGGEIFGIHKVFFFLEGEWVAFEHHATDRSVFARGAVTAALWAIKQKPGFYSMKNVLSDEAVK